MIEDIIKANTAAIEENTAVLRQILAASGGPATVAPETALADGTPVKPGKVKKDKEKTDPAPAAKEPEPAPKVEEKDPDLDGDDEELTHEILVEKAQAKLDSTPPATLAATKANFKALREKFNVKTIKELTPDQFADFAEGIEAL